MQTKSDFKIVEIERDLRVFSKENWEGEDGEKAAREVPGVESESGGRALVDAFDKAVRPFVTLTEQYL